MQVLKFGGSSIANADAINKALAIVRSALAKDRTIVVFSAISGCTDSLIKIANLAADGDPSCSRLIEILHKKHVEIVTQLISREFQHPVLKKVDDLFDDLTAIVNSVVLIRELTPLVLDLIMSFGEILSTHIISEKLNSMGVPCKWADSRELIKTEYKHKQNNVLYKESYDNVARYFASHNNRLYILPGFIASDRSGRTTTLGRGGSDFSAALLAAGADARMLEIWTDVDGMMSSDPKIVPEAQTIEHISYKEALELSHFGAKVIHPVSLRPAIDKNIPILIKNTFAPENKGTLIENNPPETNNNVKGISGNKRIALLAMEGSGMIGISGYSSRLYDVLTQNDINIILITQASSVHTMLIAIDESEADRATRAANELFAYEISLKKIEPLRVEKGFSIISLVGDDMKSLSGTAARMFEAIGDRGICIRAIAQGSSEKNVSVIVATDYFEDAIKAIHNEFFERPGKQANLFIAGYGNVGKRFVEIIEHKRSDIKNRLGVDINLIGICNSRNMMFDTNGVDITKISECLNAPHDKINSSDFIDKAVSLSMKNSVFVDCTSSYEIAALYTHILSEGVGIVTCNKIANTLDMAFYKSIHAMAKLKGVALRYETNVGAALPVISTLKQIVNSGDKINRIEATLSGALNYLFNNYDGTRSFASIVREDQELGYTEPDPRTDLKGLDLQRKALILAREIGIELEMGNVAAKSFLPVECLAGSVEDFYAAVERNEPYFKALYDQAAKNHKKLAYHIEINGQEIKTELNAFDASHPFYASKDTDNVVVIYSDFYPNGLKIQGAGAGALQTASGLLNSILQ